MIIQRFKSDRVMVSRCVGFPSKDYLMTKIMDALN